MPTITTLKTSGAKEKEELILELLDGETLPKSIERLNVMIDTANSYLDSRHASEDTRYHWAEIKLICEDLSEYFHGRLRIVLAREARHAEKA